MLLWTQCAGGLFLIHPIHTYNPLIFSAILYPLICHNCMSLTLSSYSCNLCFLPAISLFHFLQVSSAPELFVSSVLLLALPTCPVCCLLLVISLLPVAYVLLSPQMATHTGSVGVSSLLSPSACSNQIIVYNSQYQQIVLSYIFLI